MLSTDKIIVLESSDGVQFQVEKAVALQFGKIRQEIDQMNFPAKAILLPEVTSTILPKVIDYCEMHVVDVNTDPDSSVAGDDLKAWDAEVNRARDAEDKRAVLLGLIGNFSKLIVHCKMHVVDGDDLEAWDAEFVKVDQSTLIELIQAAYDLKIESLLDLTTRNLADMIKGKTKEEFIKQFRITNDFTREEEEKFRRENQWDFLVKSDT